MQHAPASSPPTVAFDKFERNVQARCYQGAMKLIPFYCSAFCSCFTRLWLVTDSKTVPLEWHLERTQISLLLFHYMPKFPVGIRIYQVHDIGAIFRRLARILSKRNFLIYVFPLFDLANVSCHKKFNPRNLLHVIFQRDIFISYARLQMHLAARIHQVAWQ